MAKRLPLDQAIGGLQVLALVRDDACSETRLYQVRYGCCGKLAELTQRQILHRRTHGHTRCHRCAMRAKSYRSPGVHAVIPLAPGEVIANARIERVTVPAVRARELTYAVMFLCCGHRTEQTHQQLVARRQKNSVRCAWCGPNTSRDSDPVRRAVMLDIKQYLAKVFRAPRADGGTSDRGFHTTHAYRDRIE